MAGTIRILDRFLGFFSSIPSYVKAGISHNSHPAGRSQRRESRGDQGMVSEHLDEILKSVSRAQAELSFTQASLGHLQMPRHSMGASPAQAKSEYADIVFTPASPAPAVVQAEPDLSDIVITPISTNATSEALPFTIDDILITPRV